MTTILAIASAKGGVGKTTTAVSLASGLAQLESVLLVDFDSQGHIAISFGLPPRPGVYDWLMSDLPLADCLLTGRPPGLAILPSDSMTKAVERNFSDPAHLAMLADRMGTIPHEFAVIDTSSRGLLQELAIAVADQIVIPFEAESLSVAGVYDTLELVAQLNAGADVTILPVAYDRRLSEHRLNLSILRENLGRDELQEEFVIPARSAVKQCPSFGRTIWEHDGRGIEDARIGYMRLIERVLRLEGRAVMLERLERHNGYTT